MLLVSITHQAPTLLVPVPRTSGSLVPVSPSISTTFSSHSPHEHATRGERHLLIGDFLEEFREAQTQLATASSSSSSQTMAMSGTPTPPRHPPPAPWLKRVLVDQAVQEAAYCKKLRRHRMADGSNAAEAVEANIAIVDGTRALQLEEGLLFIPLASIDPPGNIYKREVRALHKGTVCTTILILLGTTHRIM